MHDFIHTGITVDGKKYYMVSVINRKPVDPGDLGKGYTHEYALADTLNSARQSEFASNGTHPVLALFVRDKKASWLQDQQRRATVLGNVTRVRVEFTRLGDDGESTMSIKDTRALSEDTLIVPYYYGDNHKDELAVYDRNSGQTLFTKNQLDAMCQNKVRIDNDTDRPGAGAPWFT